jgi:hypothetical protein
LLNLSTKRMSAEAEISLSREIEWGITLSSLLSLQRTKPLFPPSLFSFSPKSWKSHELL